MNNDYLIFISFDQQTNQTSNTNRTINDHLLSLTYHYRSHDYYWLLLLVIELVAFLGNICLILLILLNRNLYTNNTTRIVFSLSLTDLLLSVFVLPFTLHYQINFSLWYLGFNTCALWLSMDIQLTTTSIFHLCSISYERYLSMAEPMKYRSNIKQRIKFLIGMNWFLSFFLVTLPFLLLAFNQESNIYREHEAFKERYVCQFFMNSFIVYTTFITFWLPLVLMIFFGIKSMCLLRTLDNRKRNNLNKYEFSSSITQNDSFKSENNNSFSNNRRQTLRVKRKEKHTKIKQKQPQNGNLIENFSNNSEDTLTTESPKSLNNYQQQQQINEKRIQFDYSSKSNKFSLRRFSNVSQFGKQFFKNFISTRKELQAQKILSIVLIVFVLSYFPLFLFITISSLSNVAVVSNDEKFNLSTNLSSSLARHNEPSLDLLSLVFYLLTWLGYSSAAMNPILHLTLNNNIKSALRNCVKPQRKIVRHYRRRAEPVAV